jgi:enoyl-CoA hydratase/carnithine racemase
VRYFVIWSNGIFEGLFAEYEYIIAEVRGKTGLITLNRPKALNALCTPLLADITHACRAFDDNKDVGAIVITGSEKAFAAGADIKEMAKQEYVDCYTNNMFADWTEITKVRKPV